jgi:hypothetical protein
MFNTIVTMLGFLIVMGSVGGIEQSTSDAVMIQCGMLALAGLALMWAGVSGINQTTRDTMVSLYHSDTYGDRSQYQNN